MTKRTVQLGPGTVILHDCTVSVNAVVGKHVVVLSNSVVSHDNVIGDYSCIARGVCLSGNITVRESTYLGTNASIMGSKTIGALCLVGMASLVSTDVGDNSVAAGNPARFVRETQKELTASIT
jgi:serine acetyltransferase